MNMLSLFPTSTDKHRADDQPLSKLRNDIDRIFEDFTSGFRFPAMFRGSEDGRLVPSIEVEENDKQITVSTELPGINEDDIDVSITDQMLTISGEKKHVSEKKEGDSYMSERAYGKFSRSMSLPFSVDESTVDARYDKGVLTLVIPKPADTETKTKKIHVKAAA